MVVIFNTLLLIIVVSLVKLTVNDNYNNLCHVYQSITLTEDNSYAEMDKDVKNSISHRRRAINNMRDYFTSQKRHAMSSTQETEDNKKSKLET